MKTFDPIDDPRGKKEEGAEQIGFKDGQRSPKRSQSPGRSPGRDRQARSAKNADREKSPKRSNQIVVSEIEGFESALKPLKQEEEKNASLKSPSKSPKPMKKSERKSVSANQKQR